ncbi:hypothetical protein DNTS_021851, partial [Danionella cerebrum]
FTDIDECLAIPSVCGPNSTCTNTQGDYSNPCTDFNECLAIPPVCGPNSICNNTQGSYNCSCSDGFTATNASLPISISNPCTDINECEHTLAACGPNATCTNTYGSFYCTCLDGMGVEHPDLPISVSNPCIVPKSVYDGELQIDLFNNASVNYLLNALHYIVLPYTLGSINLLEVSQTTVCALNSTRYDCKCESGYVWPTTICNANPMCDIPVGGTCGCIQALPSEGSLCQKDINECLAIPSVCGPNSTCTNTQGDYSCSCQSGFTVTNSSLKISISNPCTDINECLAIPSVCGPNSTCTNTQGDYSCSCSDGFTVTNSSLKISISNPCTDFNECLAIPPVCGPNSICNNTQGSYNCSCKSGFTATNASLPISISNPCTDINECEHTLAACGPNATCTNTYGSFYCTCLDGMGVEHPNLPISVSNPCIVPKSVYDGELQIDLFNNASVNYLLNALHYIVLPYTLGSINLLEVSKTTVCALNSTRYDCKCESGYVWPTTICNANPMCDIPVGGTCGCIQALPSEGPLCQKATTPTPTPATTPGSIPATTPAPIPATTPTPATPSPSAPSTRPSTSTTPKITEMTMTMSLNMAYETSFAINSRYAASLTGYVANSLAITGFRPGSVLVDYKFSSTSTNLDYTAANTALVGDLKAQGIDVSLDSFAQSDPYNFIKDKVYPFQKMDLSCSASGDIKWTVNGKNAALDTSKYALSNNSSTLTVKNLTELDSGRYSCISQKGTIPYIQWQEITVEQRPTITVGTSSLNFLCNLNNTFQLKCSVDAGYDVEWVLDGQVQTAVSGYDGSITLSYTLYSADEVSKIFTCRLKLVILKDYAYSWSTVTATTKAKHEFDLGGGYAYDIKTKSCPSGTKGTEKYECKSSKWEKIEDNCVLTVISNLLNQVQTLQVGNLSGFLVSLTNATIENTAVITSSTPNLKAVVEILHLVAEISQSTLIDQPVMNNFLKNVDVIVSNNSTLIWSQLNKRNTNASSITPSNSSTSVTTSVKLLDATEKMSGVLTDYFTVNQTTIQLNRIKVNDSLSLASAFPNSTTEINIPWVPEETDITVIIFTTLNNVLPTPDDYNNGSVKSNLNINGDVIIVKVNKTLSNISFTFDTINQSLGNAQCVFWNFNLGGWDTTGCEVKKTNESGIVSCECNHTTPFSILMSPFAIESIVLAYITYIGVSISMASLVLCIIFEAIVWKEVTKNSALTVRHASIINIAVSLLIANICFFIGAAIADKQSPIPVGPCSPVVFFMHFFYLALFFWMLILALLLFYKVLIVFDYLSQVAMLVIAYIVGYVSPLLIASITVASTAGPQNYISKKNSCWLNWDESKALLAFVIPALTIVAINLIVLIVVLCKMLISQYTSTSKSRSGEKSAIFVIIRCLAFLTPIFGITWGFGIGTMVSREFGIHLVFTLLNSLQGLFVLIFGTLVDKEVRKALKKPLQKIFSSRTRSTTAGPSSSSGLTDILRRKKKKVYNVQGNTSSHATSEGTSGSYNPTS